MPLQDVFMMATKLIKVPYQKNPNRYSKDKKFCNHVKHSNLSIIN